MSWDKISFIFNRWASFKGARIGSGVSELHNGNGERQLLIFGGIDPYTFSRMTRFINTFEEYDSAMQECNYPGVLEVLNWSLISVVLSFCSFSYSWTYY